MMTQVVVALLAYVVLVLVVGLVTARRSGDSPEEYFLANRGLGRVVLFMALFGTNCTPFVLVGIPAQAWLDGVGIFGLNAPIVALGIPLSFWAIGSPARRMGIRLGALTPAELMARRFGSRALGGLLFVVFTVYTIPYMVSAVKGAATSLDVVTDGALPPALGGAAVLLVALVYTALGGMRATAWTNVVQGTLFLGFMLVALFVVARSLGGFAEATAAVARHDETRLVLGDRPRFAPRAWASYGLVISLTVVGFPHMFVRLMAARGDGALKASCRVYPLALAALWLPAVMLGVWASAALPDLDDPDRVFSAMTSAHMPPALAALGSVAVLAAVMSTLDAQILTLSSMLVRDVLDPLRGRASSSGGAGDVRAGRLFAVLVAGVTWALAQSWGDSVFRIALLAFGGYVTLVPLLFLAVRWRRCTTAGAVASVLTGSALYAGGELGWFPTAGFLPVLPATVGALLAAWLVSLAGPAPDRELVARAFARH